MRPRIGEFVRACVRACFVHACGMRAGKGHLELVRVLMDAKASLNVKDTMGHLPEDDAEVEGHHDIYVLLRETRGEKVGRVATETALDRLHNDVSQQHRALRHRVQCQVKEREGWRPPSLHTRTCTIFCAVTTIFL